MAIYHLTAKTVSRRQRSAVSAAAYRAGQALDDRRQDRTFDFTRKEGIRSAEIILPDNSPEWMSSRENLWNAAEAAEKRADAMTAREIEVALPRELDDDVQRQIIHDFVHDQLISRGLAADIAIHDAVDAHNQPQPHAHILFKDRAVDLDSKTGFSGKKDRGFNRPADIERLREAWAHHVNAELAERDRIDHRSLADQHAEAEVILEKEVDAAIGDGRDPNSDPDVIEAQAAVIELDREPQPHLGVAAAGMRERGEWSERSEEHDRICSQNAEVSRIADQMRSAARRIRDRVDALRRQVADVFRKTPAPASAPASAPTIAEMAAMFRPPEPQPEPEPEPEPELKSDPDLSFIVLGSGRDDVLACRPNQDICDFEPSPPRRSMRM